MQLDYLYGFMVYRVSLKDMWNYSVSGIVLL